MQPGLEAIIGLEVHVQLRTRTKLFCACRNAYGAPPNSLTCPVCLGLPGSLPVLNGEAVRQALVLGTALEARIQPLSTFYRKQYVYPDLPKGYQITQGPMALVEDGVLEIPGDPAVRGAEGPVRARIERAHLEEDAGKSHHELSREGSAVDLNRAGVPLLEVVGRPDLRSPQEAQEALKALHGLVTWLGICDGSMEEGSLRCDANVSLRRQGETGFGIRVEVKNLNSFRFVRQALAYEIDRHIALLERGEAPLAETRGFDPDAGETRPQRSKEAALDYRFFPEPDLQALTVSPDEVEAARADLPELPAARRERFRREHGIGEAEAAALVQSRAFADFFEAAAKGSSGKGAANWMLGEVSRVLNERGCALAELGLDPAHLGELVRLVEGGTLSHGLAKEAVFPALLAGEGGPSAIVERKGLAQVCDRGAIERLVREVLAAHPDPVAQFKAGKASLKGFLVGQVMKAGQGKVNPQLVNEVLLEELAR
ncbi:MAG TPA: Asp-tRNA(Asn)/Glu-tRNA(Gln) amidotransferase subunit GatB [Holophagaceae bacterium]|nr:Asp-tRNA(Asn)/Glu-tRNA(Gln) amidotransferase subunit GatB [Holophagaceae bacterium]